MFTAGISCVLTDEPIQISAALGEYNDHDLQLATITTQANNIYCPKIDPV